MDLVVAHYQEDLSWLNRFESLFNAIFVYEKSPRIIYPPMPYGTIHTPLVNTGREAHTYLYHMYVARPCYPVVYVQGNPFAHITEEQFVHAVENYQSGFNWMSEVWHVCDRNGSPHHPGLPVGNFWEDLTDTQFEHSFPEGLKFIAGGQFIIDTTPKNLTKIIWLCENRYEEYPWILERLWKYVF